LVPSHSENRPEAIKLSGLHVHRGISASTTLTHESVQLHLRATKTRYEKWYYVVGGMGSQFTFFSFNPDLETAKCALLERVYFHEVSGGFEPPFKPEARIVDGLLQPFSKEFDRLVVTSHPVALDTYPSVYTGRRRALYEKAAKKVLVSGFIPKYAYLNSFVKCEKLQTVTSKSKEPNKWVNASVPRLIQPRKPEFNVCVGRFLRHLELKIFSMVNRVFGDSAGRDAYAPVIQKGFNTFQRAQHMYAGWSRISNPRAIILDATRFDQHVNPSVLRWEHRRYLKFYGGSDRRELSKLLSAQIHNRGYIRTSEGKIKYEVEGGRCSGDMNTSLGNCLIMCAAVYAYMHSLKIAPRDFALINDGDDCVLIVHDTDADRVASSLAEWFKKIGFLIKVGAPVAEFEDIGFCQTHPVFDGHIWRLVRNFPESLSKDATVLIDITNPAVYPRYFRSIGDCGAALTFGMPVLQEYYECFRRAASGLPLDHPVFETGMYRLAAGLSPRYEPVTDEARVSFAKAFGLLPDAQLEIEQYYRTLDLKDLKVYREPGPRLMIPVVCSTVRL